MPDEQSAAAAYRQALADGTMRSLTETDAYTLVRAAGADAAHDMTDELGALRLVLARLLVEQLDLKALSEGVVKIVSVAVRAAQVHHALNGGGGKDARDAIVAVLSDYDETRELANSEPVPAR